MYCKFSFEFPHLVLDIVLIVAKCIVNLNCRLLNFLILFVLIVAKCIVNEEVAEGGKLWKKVLIVAKCIVNSFSFIVSQTN